MLHRALGRRPSSIRRLHAARQSFRSYTTAANTLQHSRTIFALSTPWGISGVSVLRVSGKHATTIFERMTKPKGTPPPRMSTLREIVDPENPSDVIDKGIVVFYPGPKSYTGEDVVELQVHGSIGVVRDLLGALQKLPSFAPAEPGEFTKRAWMNNKFRDLTMVEAIGDLLHAETSAQRRQAQSQLRGELGKLYEKWSNDIHTCLAHLEAVIDFGDDELLDENIANNISQRISSLLQDMEAHLRDGHRGEILRNGITVCLAGRPNAGKSSLLNILSKRDVSIVSPEAGTTRDVVEVRLDLSGYPLILQDTAGVRDDQEVGLVEKEGINRALLSFQNANIRLVLVDLSQATQNNFDEVTDNILLQNDGNNGDKFSASTIIVLNKLDVLSEQNENMQSIKSRFEKMGYTVCCISCKTGEGIDELLGLLTNTVRQFFETKSFEGPLMTRTRHRQHLKECVEALREYLAGNKPLELAAEDLRVAGKSIAKITGRVNVEQLLDIVFRDFCIGK